MPGHVLAIDLGTSGPKVGLVSARGEVEAHAFSPVELILLPGGGAEQRPDDWWRAVADAARRVIESAPGTVVAAVAVTGQWSGTVPIDAGGAAIGNAIIWMDSRGADEVARFIGGPVRVEGYDPRKLRRWIRLTGGAPSRSGKDPIGHILWLRANRPEVYGSAACFLEPKDYLNLRLTGAAAASYDSIALHWVTDNRDPDLVAYDDDLLELTGLDRDRLPRLLPATGVVGTVTRAAAADLGVSAGIPVIAGTPDLHSAAIGAGTTGDLEGHLYLGTSSWLVCHVSFKKTDLLHNIASLPAAVAGRYLVANEQETAGKALEWLSHVLYPDRDDRDGVLAEMNHMAAGVPAGSGGVIFTPWLYGERTPVEDATLRAGFFNQSLDTGRAEMVRAVFEGVAYNTRWLLGYVEKFTGTRLDPIVTVGGGARSELWCRIHADVLGRTIRQAADPLLVNVRGAGLLAHAALGHIGWEEVPALVPIAAEFVPDPSTRPVYDRRFDAFRRIHRAGRRIYRSLR